MIELRTPVPGPKSAALLARRKAAVLPGVSTMHPIFIERASGSTVTDVDGNTFIDFTGGIGVMNVGHGQPAVIDAVTKQAERFTHVSWQVMGYEPYVEAAEALIRIAPGDFEKRVMLISAGVEAIENAVKIARSATKRGAVLCFDHGFHGRTMLGLSLTGKAVPYKAGLGPFVPEIYRLPFPYPYRGQGVEGSVEHALKTLVRPEDLAAIVVEPVLGEGGFLVAPVSFLQELRELATRYGIVLIIDEVQSGFGRTGAMFACQTFGVTPDLMAVAKSLAAGMPLAAVVGRADLMDTIQPGALGGTYGGNPLAAVAALQAIRILEETLASGHVDRLASRLRSKLDELAARVPLIGEVRGLGAMLAIELVRDRVTKDPAVAETAAIVADARAHGLLLLPAGTYGNVIRFLLPLTTSLDVLDEGLGVLERALMIANARVQ